MKKMLVILFLSFTCRWLSASSSEASPEYAAFWLQRSVDGLQKQIHYYQWQMQAKDTTLKSRKYFFEKILSFEQLRDELQRRIWALKKE